MTQIGRKYQVGFGKETTRGTVIAPTKYMPLLDLPGLEDAPEYINNEQSIGNIAGSDGADVIKTIAKGGLSGKVGDSQIGYLLLGALGTVATSDALGAKLHEFTLKNDAEHPSMTVDIKNDVEQRAYALAMIDTLTITADVDSSVQYAVDIISKSSVASTETPVYVMDNEFIARHVEIKIASTVAGLSGATALDLSSVELGIKKNVEEKYSLGSLNPSVIPNKTFSADGSFEGRFEDVVLKTLSREGTKQAMSISIINTGVTIGTTNPEISFVLPSVSFQGVETSGGLGDITMQSITFEAHYDADTSSILSADLRNETASY